MFDKDDDGKITIQEMKNTLRAMGEILTEEEIDEAFQSLDIDGQFDSGITFDGFRIAKFPLPLCCSF